VRNGGTKQKSKTVKAPFSSKEAQGKNKSNSENIAGSIQEQKGKKPPKKNKKQWGRRLTRPQ